MSALAGYTAVRWNLRRDHPQQSSGV